MSSRYIPDIDKKIILERQKYRCANVPGADLYRLGDFPCLLWEGTRNGVFMDNMYEFDHIVEFSLTKDNSIDNIQLLCPNCHSRRTKDFVKELALAKRKGLINEFSGNEECVTATRERQKSKVKPIYFSKEQIITVDEREHSIKSLLIKQKRRELDETEQCILRKLKLIELFGMTVTSDRELLGEFLNEYIGQEIRFRRFEHFFGYIDDGIADDKKRCELIVDILNRFLEKNNAKYKSDELINLSLNAEQYGKGMLNIVNNSMYFKDEEKNRSLFFKNKGKFANANQKDKQHYSKTVLFLLDGIGIKLGISGRVQVAGKRTYVYSLSVDGEIKDIIDLKYGAKRGDIDKYDCLFKKF